MMIVQRAKPMGSIDVIGAIDDTLGWYAAPVTLSVIGIGALGFVYAVWRMSGPKRAKR